MRRLLATALVLTATLIGSGAAAQKTGTVVELYTSQGCSSCPPADAMLEDLAKRSDVIALALHVDYWDYIGWKDDLADPAYTQRQKNYAAAAGSDTVYTPQMIIGGQDHVIGSRPMQVMDQVQRHNALPDPVSVNLRKSGGTLTINAEATGRAQDTIVQVVRYTPLVTRDIGRGENAGKTIAYANVVNSWQTAGRWNTREPLQMQVRLSGSDPVVVIVQAGSNGPILGAAELN